MYYGATAEFKTLDNVILPDYLKHQVPSYFQLVLTGRILYFQSVRLCT